MFAGLTSAYIVSASRRDWVDFELPSEFYISTCIIVLSSLTLFLAKKSIKSENLKGATIMTIITFILGVVFVIMQFSGFDSLTDLNIYFTGQGSSVSASFVYLIVIAHLAHIVAGLIALLIITINMIKGKYSGENYLGFELGAIFWHFVDLLWIFLLSFLLLY